MMIGNDVYHQHLLIDFEPTTRPSGKNSRRRGAFKNSKNDNGIWTLVNYPPSSAAQIGKLDKYILSNHMFIYFSHTYFGMYFAFSPATSAVAKSTLFNVLHYC
jgi:hypothetical protein